jgi:hypothetical protein
MSILHNTHEESQGNIWYKCGVCDKSVTTAGHLKMYMSILHNTHEESQGTGIYDISVVCVMNQLHG